MQDLFQNYVSDLSKLRDELHEELRVTSAIPSFFPTSELQCQVGNRVDEYPLYESHGIGF